MQHEQILSVSRAYLKRSFLFSALILFSAALLALPIGWLASVLIDSASFAVVAVFAFAIGFSFGLYLAVSGYRVSQWMLLESVNVVFNRSDAEIHALEQGITNNIAVKGRGNVVAVGNTPTQTQEVIRLVPFKSSHRLIDGVDQNDLSAFIEGIFLRGHSQRAWMGQRLPSGRTITTFEEYDALIRPLLTAGVIVDRKERSAGKLAYASAQEVKEVLGL